MGMSKEGGAKWADLKQKVGRCLTFAFASPIVFHLFSAAETPALNDGSCCSSSARLHRTAPRLKLTLLPCRLHKPRLLREA